MASCPGVPGRMERVETGAGGPLALVDFAHSPDALERLLVAARGLVADGGRLVVVFGAGGDRDPHKRPAMGAIAVRGADVVVLTSDNPRSEDPLAILAAIRRGADEALAAGAAARLEVEPDRRAAVAAGRRRWPGRVTCWWWPARATRPARRSTAWCTRSTTGRARRGAARRSPGDRR